MKYEVEHDIRNVEPQVGQFFYDSDGLLNLRIREVSNMDVIVFNDDCPARLRQISFADNDIGPVQLIPIGTKITFTQE